MSSCLMSNSTRPPEWPDESSRASDEHKQKLSESEKKNHSTTAEKLINIVHERAPEVYSLGQQLSEKSLAAVNGIMQTSTTSITSEANKKKPEDWNDILNRWYQQYQDFVGITDLKKAQDRVTELSEVLLATQSRRRQLQGEIEDLQEKLAVNHQRITKAEQYSEEHFKLFDQAREMNEQMKAVRSEFTHCERLERDTFTQLSAAIRDCHERERMQAEQSKYWSIIASVVSAAVASVITSVNNWVRIREIKDHVSSTNQHLLDGYQQMHQDVLGTITSLVNPIHSAISHTGLVSGSETGTDQALSTSDAAESTDNGLSASSDAMQHSADSASLQSLENNLSSAPNICESSEGPIPAMATKDDVTHMTEDLKLTVSQQINSIVGKEKELLLEQLNAQLKTLITQIVSEGDRAKKDIESMIKMTMVEALSSLEEVSKPVVPLSEEHQEPSPTVVVEYSYRCIATAMAVGAGIGTLATAFLLGSFGGPGA